MVADVHDHRQYIEMQLIHSVVLCTNHLSDYVLPIRATHAASSSSAKVRHGLDKDGHSVRRSSK